MFQFPGFALINLCIQSISTCFTPLLKPAEAGNNNRVSGGLPHSEIHGSKLILSSPWLIAEYHVFHRLLLPRHSPNALFALDLIQKKKDLRQSRPSQLVTKRWSLFWDQKHTFSRLVHSNQTMNNAYSRSSVQEIGVIVLVSVLDLDNTFFSGCIRRLGRGNSRTIACFTPKGSAQP